MTYTDKDKLLAIRLAKEEPNNLHPIWLQILEDMEKHYEKRLEETKKKGRGIMEDA